MRKWLGLIFGFVVVAVGLAASIAQILSYLETSRLLPAGLKMFAEIPLPILNATIAMAIFVGLSVGLTKLVRLQGSWERTRKQWEDEHRAWIVDREKEIRERGAAEVDAISRFRETYESRLHDLERAIEEGAKWSILQFGGRDVKLTNEAYNFYDNCTEAKKARIREHIAALAKQHFYISEIREMAGT